MKETIMAFANYTAPGLTLEEGKGISEVLQARLHDLNIAERMATLGATPNGLAGALVAQRTVEDYAVGRAPVAAHLRALNDVYTRVIEAHRKAIEFAGESDPVTEDLLIGQTAELEKFQWFIRAFLENGEGNI